MTPKSIERTVDPVRDSFEKLLVVTFAKSMSATYSLAVGVARGAAKYSEMALDRQTVHLAAFDRTLDEATRALSLLRYLSGMKSLQVFIHGKPVSKVWDVTTVLECYINAMTCTDQKAHCHTVIEDPFSVNSPRLGMTMRVTLTPGPDDDEKGSTRYLFPCRHLERGFRFQLGHPSRPEDLIQAAAVAEGCHWCPLFDAKAFRRLPRQVRIGDDVFEVAEE